jgi:hypothetical protein
MNILEGEVEINSIEEKKSEIPNQSLFLTP